MLAGAFDDKMKDGTTITKMGRVNGKNESWKGNFVHRVLLPISRDTRLLAPASLYESNILFRDALPGNKPWLERFIRGCFEPPRSYRRYAS